MHPLDTEQLIGHKNEIASFLQAYNSKRLHHAWLFTGNKGIGKAAIAYNLALFLLSNPTEPTSIEIKNDHLKNKIKNGSHPDILILSSEDEDGEDVGIAVEQVRKINEFLRLTAVESKYRVVIVDGIEGMNSNAANAFLKILEEPPSHVVFLIVCHSIGKIIPTIRSRCRVVKMNNLNFEEFSNVMRTNGVLDSSEISTLYDISDGSVSAALTFSSSDNLKIYETVQKLFANKKRTVSDIFELSKIASDKTKWHVIRYAIQKELYSLSKKTSANKEAVLEHIEKLNKFISDGERFHLDKSQLITSVFL